MYFNIYIRIKYKLNIISSLYLDVNLKIDNLVQWRIEIGYLEIINRLFVSKLWAPIGWGKTGYLPPPLDKKY